TLVSCTTNSLNLTATTTGTNGGAITFPTADNTNGVWEVLDSPEGYVFDGAHFPNGVSNPSAVFTPGMLGEYTLNWTLTNEDLEAECIPPASVSFKLFDQYTLTADADAGSCGNFVIQLSGTTTGIWQNPVAFPTQDGYVGQWRVEGGTGTFSDAQDPEAIFTA